MSAFLLHDLSNKSWEMLILEGIQGAVFWREWGQFQDFLYLSEETYFFK